MGPTACTEPQCLYKGAVYFLPYSPRNGLHYQPGYKRRHLRYRQWRSLSDEEKNYLIQIMPPLDVIPEIIRSIVIFQNITNAGILFDDTIGKSHI